MNSPGIYSILQLSTGLHYVGSAKSIARRWSKHVSDLRAGKHHNPKLQHSWNKHGSADFRLDIIELCEERRLVEREQFWIDTTLPYFNILRVARSALGQRHTDEAIARMKQPRLDLAEKRFGRLVAIEVSGRNSAGHYMWRCICDCGKEKRVGASKLSTGHTVSCGCLRKELAAAQGKRFRDQKFNERKENK